MAGVTTTRPSRDREVRHHRHVLVLEVVAVEHVPAGVVGEADGDLTRLARQQVDRVLPAVVAGPRIAAVAGQHLEVVQVDVDRVVEVGEEPPHLDVPQPRRGVVVVGAEWPAGHHPAVGAEAGVVGPTPDSAPGSRWSWKANVRVVTASVGSRRSTAPRRSGTAASFSPSRTTSKAMTRAVEPRPRRFTRTTRVPVGTAAKSTTTSARSAGASVTVARRRGASSRPPSVPTWLNAKGRVPASPSASSASS